MRAYNHFSGANEVSTGNVFRAKKGKEKKKKKKRNPFLDEEERKRERAEW